MRSPETRSASSTMHRWIPSSTQRITGGATKVDQKTWSQMTAAHQISTSPVLAVRQPEPSTIPDGVSMQPAWHKPSQPLPHRSNSSAPQPRTAFSQKHTPIQPLERRSSEISVSSPVQPHDRSASIQITVLPRRMPKLAQTKQPH